MGFDSLRGIELKNSLADLTGLSLSSTLVMTYPTINALADHLHSRLFGDEPLLAPENTAATLASQTASIDRR